MTHSLIKGAVAAAVLAASALSVEPASAMPVAGVDAVSLAAPAGSPAVEQVRWWHHHRGYYHRGYGWRGGWHRRGWRRGLPGHPIRRILRAL